MEIKRFAAQKFLMQHFEQKAQKRCDVLKQICRFLILTFLSQLSKENLGEGGYLVDIVDNTEGHVADLSLHLDHVVQDQPGQHGQGILPNLKIYNQWIKLLTFSKFWPIKYLTFLNPDLSTFRPFWPFCLSDILNIWHFEYLDFDCLNFWHSEIILPLDVLPICLSDLETF